MQGQEKTQIDDKNTTKSPYGTWIGVTIWWKIEGIEWGVVWLCESITEINRDWEDIEIQYIGNSKM